MDANSVRKKGMAGESGGLRLKESNPEKTGSDLGMETGRENDFSQDYMASLRKKYSEKKRGEDRSPKDVTVDPIRSWDDERTRKEKEEKMATAVDFLRTQLAEAKEKLLRRDKLVAEIVKQREEAQASAKDWEENHNRVVQQASEDLETLMSKIESLTDEVMELENEKTELVETCEELNAQRQDEHEQYAAYVQDQIEKEPNIPVMLKGELKMVKNENQNLVEVLNEEVSRRKNLQVYVKKLTGFIEGAGLEVPEFIKEEYDDDYVTVEKANEPSGSHHSLSEHGSQLSPVPEQLDEKDEDENRDVGNQPDDRGDVFSKDVMAKDVTLNNDGDQHPKSGKRDGSEMNGAGEAEESREKKRGRKIQVNHPLPYLDGPEIGEFMRRKNPLYYVGLESQYCEKPVIVTEKITRRHCEPSVEHEEKSQQNKRTGGGSGGSGSQSGKILEGGRKPAWNQYQTENVRQSDLNADQGFKARPIPNFKKRFVPARSEKGATVPTRKLFWSEYRAFERNESYKPYMEEKRKKAEEERIAKAREQQRIDRAEIRALRKQQEFKARPMPNFSQPFNPSMAFKYTRDAQAPKLATSARDQDEIKQDTVPKRTAGSYWTSKNQH